MSRGSVPQSTSRTRSAVRMVVHLAGFGLCIGLLLWLIDRTLSDEATRSQLVGLADAPRREVAVLLLLTAASMFFNGLTFWLVIRPVREVPHGDVQAVNGIAYLMANLPLRLGFLFRIAVHHRRNDLPLMTIGGWMGAVAVVMAIGLAPPLLAGLWRSEPDALWWVVTLGGMVTGAVTVVLVARFFSAGRGWRLIERFAQRRADSFLGRTLRSDALTRLHDGVRMLANPGAVSAAVAVRALDMLVQGLRFMVAASLLGVALPLDQAVLLTAVYFAVDSIAPTGSLGIKEAATAMAARALGENNLDGTVLTVTAAELIVRFAGAGAGAVWLRPDRILRASMGRTIKSSAEGEAVGVNGQAGQRTTPAAACSDSTGSPTSRN